MLRQRENVRKAVRWQDLHETTRVAEPSGAAHQAHPKQGVRTLLVVSYFAYVKLC
jgi:uncharacterized protein involved in propanediol utilization